MKLIAYLSDGKTVDIRPAPLERGWMDATDQRFAYRCLPVNIANTHGWEILCPSAFTATWAGEPDPGSIAIVSSDKKPPVVSHFGSGILTFRLACVFRTDPGYDLVAQGPVNRPKDAITALSGIVETDWAPFSFTMNWMFTQPEIEVSFDAGEPFCHIYPIRRGEIEAVEPEFRPMSDDPQLEAQYRAWTASRVRFNADLKRPGSQAEAQRWQKHYYRGVDLQNRTADGHRIRLKLKSFAPASKTEPYGARTVRAANQPSTSVGKAALAVPPGSTIPDQFLQAAAASPILRRAPIADMLEPFHNPARWQRAYTTLDGYFRAAMTQPYQMQGGLTATDLTIAAMLDAEALRLARLYRDRPQTERVSILMPTCDRSDVIPDAILSVLFQSYRNWELLIIDDAGDARTRDVVESFADARIRYILGGRRGGTSAARNHALREAGGEIVAYLDDDNQWHPDRLLIALNAMRDRRGAMIYSAQAIWTGFDPQTRLGQDFESLCYTPPNRSLLENANFIDTNMCLHDRALIDEVGGFDPAIAGSEDWDLFLRMSEAVVPIALPCILSHYFRRRAPAIHPKRDSGADWALVQERLAAGGGGARTIAAGDGATVEVYATAERSRRKRVERLKALGKGRCGIVILHREHLSGLMACIDSIAACTATPYDIVVADLGSSEETRVDLKDLADARGLRYAAVDDPDAAGAALAAGVARFADGQGDIAVLRSDAVVTADWLDELRRVLREHPSVGLAAARQVLFAGNPRVEVHVPAARSLFEADVTLSALHGNVLDPAFDPENGLVELTFARLTGVLFRAATLAELGPLDAFGDQLDHVVCNAVRHTLKQKIVYTPHSKVYHLDGIRLRATGPAG